MHYSGIFLGYILCCDECAVCEHFDMILVCVCDTTDVVTNTGMLPTGPATATTVISPIVPGLDSGSHYASLLISLCCPLSTTTVL